MSAGRGCMLIGLLASVVALPAAATHTPIVGIGTATLPGDVVWDATLTWGNFDSGDATLVLRDPVSAATMPPQRIPATKTLLLFEILDGQRPGCFLWERYTFRIEAATPPAPFGVGVPLSPVLSVSGVQEWNLCTNERHGHYEGTYLGAVALDLCEGNCLRL